MSGRRDSNPLPTAWEAVALPGELLPLLFVHNFTGSQFTSSMNPTCKPVNGRTCKLK